MDKKTEVYSYHTFILPVVWKDDSNNSKNFEKLIYKLLKTANKYSGFKQKKVQVSISFVDKIEIQKINTPQNYILQMGWFLVVILQVKITVLLFRTKKFLLI